MTDLIILLIVVGAVTGIVYKKVKDMRAGKSGCGCGCSGCTGQKKKDHCGQ